MSLNVRQSLFVQEYISNGYNATQAALSAGYSERTAYSQGHDLLKNPEIKQKVKEIIEEKCLDTDQVLDILANQARGLPSDCYDESGNIIFERVKELNLTGLVKKITRYRNGRVDVELVDPQKALELIGKAHSLYADKTELAASGDITIRVEYVNQDDSTS